jgi:hypothetical protein
MDMSFQVCEKNKKEMLRDIDIKSSIQLKLYFSEKDLIKNNIQLSAQHTSQFYLNISYGIYESIYVDFMHACDT